MSAPALRVSRLIGVSMVAGGASLYAFPSWAQQYPDVQPPPPCDARGASATETRSRQADIAVLAFRAEDEGAAHLGTGLAAGVAERLRAVRTLGVAGGGSLGRPSPDTPRDAMIIGGQLRARYLVTGEASLADPGLRVSVQLFRVADGVRVWTHEYVRANGRALDVERDLALTLAGYLSRRIDRQAATRLVRLPTKSATAYDHFMRGRHHAGLGRPEARARAVREYEAATRADPAYAEAYAQLANVQGAMLESGWAGSGLTPQALATNGLAAADRAIKLAPQSAAGWQARARLLALRSASGWPAARAAFARAAANAPYDADVRGAFGRALAQAGSFDEAEAQLQRGLAMGGRRPELLAALGAVRTSQRRYRPACAALNAAIDADRWHAPAYIHRAMARAQVGEIRDGWSDAETAVILGAATEGRAASVVVDALARDTVRANERLREFTQLAAARTPRSQLAIGEAGMPAIALAAAGRSAAALSLLERVYPRGPAVWAVLQGPAFDRVRGQSGFSRLAAATRAGNVGAR